MFRHDVGKTSIIMQLQGPRRVRLVEQCVGRARHARVKRH